LLLPGPFHPTASPCRRNLVPEGGAMPSLPPHLRGLVEGGALLPRRHAAGQREDDAPVPHDQLGHEGHLDEDGGARRQVAHADGEHVLQGAPSQRHMGGAESWKGGGARGMYYGRLWVSGYRSVFQSGVGGSIPALVDVSLSRTLDPELLPVAASTVYVTGL